MHRFAFVLLLFLFWISPQAIAQTRLPLTELSLETMRAFRGPVVNWQIAGEVYSDPVRRWSLDTKPGTGILAPTGIALDRVNDELWVANMGNYAATVYPITANGDVAPLRTIRGGPAGRTGLMIGNPGAVGYDTRRQEILVPH